ncbi:NTP transferase domain-containing protein [Ruminococcaceae bacterium OttesenSCG-928-I18]|nr:NTP transferase domain-containing protein [Ruminococcaceae bacterium OttesenSCG-928-I18]
MNLDDFILPEGCTALQAMEQIDRSGQRTVFLAPGGKLRAVLTDSDIRRHLLRGGSLSVPADEVANHRPKSLPVAQRAQARRFLQQHSIDAVPLLGSEGEIVDIVFANENAALQKKNALQNPVVVMAGGQGTRLYPYTKILPKPLIPVGEVPILELLLERFYGFGCRDFHLIVNYKKNMIKSYFTDVEKDWRLHFEEEEEALGTGGGLCLLKGKLNDTFFFTNCDILIDADYSDILRFHKKRGNTVTLVCAAKQFVLPYGVVQADEKGRFEGLSEKPQMNYLTNTGLYVVEPAVVERMEDGKKQGFPDVIEACRSRGESVGVYPVSEDSWMDMGQLEELEAMRRRLEASQ